MPTCRRLADEVRGKLAGLGTMQLIAPEQLDSYGERQVPEADRAELRRGLSATATSLAKATTVSRSGAAELIDADR